MFYLLIMNVTINKTEQLKPAYVLVFYTNKDGVYVEYAPCEKDVFGNYSALNYRPMPYQVIQNLMEEVSIDMDHRPDRTGWGGMMPKNVLFYERFASSNNLAWIVPASVREFHLGDKSGKLHYPHLLFVKQLKTVRVYALTTDRVNNQTKLYKAPFPNVFTNDKICWGTVDEKRFIQGNPRKEIEAVERAFFGSRFTTEMMSFGKTKSPTLELLNKLMKNNQPFPKKEFEPVLHRSKNHKTIKDVLTE